MTDPPDNPPVLWRYLCFSQDETTMYVIGAGRDMSTLTYRVFVGEDVVLDELPIAGAAYAADDDAVYLYTLDKMEIVLPQDALFLPPPVAPRQQVWDYRTAPKPRWGEDALDRLNPDDYIFMPRSETRIIVQYRN